MTVGKSPSADPGAVDTAGDSNLAVALGVAFGVLGAVLIFTIIVVFICRRRQTSESANKSDPPT